MENEPHWNKLIEDLNVRLKEADEIYKFKEKIKNFLCTTLQQNQPSCRKPVQNKSTQKNTMKKIMIVILLIVIFFGGWKIFANYQSEKEAKIEAEAVLNRFQLEMDRSNEKLQTEVKNIKHAGKITEQKMKQGMSLKDALKYQKELIDSLNKK